jgi:hypothetical protein
VVDNSIDGELLVEQFIVNSHRDKWVNGDFRIQGLRRSKHYVNHKTVFGKCVAWIEDNPQADTIVLVLTDHIELLMEYPKTF